MKIHATTVTPVDTTFRAGRPYISRLYTGLFKPKRPISGTELAGRVESVGTDVNRFQPGDDIFASTADGLSRAACKHQPSFRRADPT